MANKQSVFTFHQVREKCLEGNAEGWRAFFGLYGPLALQLSRMYGTSDSTAWEKTLEALARENFARLRAMPQQSEREFLMALRVDLLEAIRTGLGDAAEAESEATGGAPLDLARITALLEGIPLLHQEMVWFKMAGYTDASIERMLRMTPQVARQPLERAMAEFGALRALEGDRCPWPRQWLALVSAAAAGKKEDCPTLHQLLRIHDGQVSWYDKEPVEKRVSSCAHCLENWTGLREVGFWRLAAPGIPADAAEAWLQRVPVSEAKKKSLFQRTSR